MKNLILLSFALLSACSSGYHAGLNQTELSNNKCALETKQCVADNKNVNVEFKISKLDTNNYLLEGFAVSKRNAYSPAFWIIDDFSFKVVSMSNDEIVNEQLIRFTKENHNNRLVFSRKFKTTKAIDAAVVSNVDITLFDEAGDFEYYNSRIIKTSFIK